MVSLYACLPACLPDRLSVCLSACLSACLSVSLSVRPSVRQSVSHSASLSVYQSLSRSVSQTQSATIQICQTCHRDSLHLVRLRLQTAQPGLRSALQAAVWRVAKATRSLLRPSRLIAVSSDHALPEFTTMMLSLSEEMCIDPCKVVFRK